MSIKYYTHFLRKEPPPMPLREFRGVIELNRALSRGDKESAASILASNFECESNDIRVLEWSRLQ